MSRLARTWRLPALIIALMSVFTAGCLSTPPGPIEAARSFDEAVAAGDGRAVQAAAGADLDLDDAAFTAAATARRGFGKTPAQYSADIAAPQASVEVFLPEADARFAVELVEEAEDRWTVVSYVREFVREGTDS